MSPVAVSAASIPAPSSDKVMIEPKKQASPGFEMCAGGIECAPGEVHPWHKPAMPTQEQFKSSPTYPVIVTPNPMATKQAIDGTADPQYAVPINQGPVTINSAFFEGIMEIHLKGLPNSQKAVFDGKKRHFQIMCQGRFKRPMSAAALCMGQEFVKPGQGPSWVADMLFNAAAKVFSNSTQVDVAAELPYFMNPVLAACQMVNVSRAGSAPGLAEAQEDMSLFSPALADKNGKPVSAAKRKKWCDVPKNLEGLMLDTEHVYTFHIWQHFIDFSAYKFSVGGLCKLDLAGPLNGQPLQLTVYDTKAKEHMFSMLVWHERLLYDPDRLANMQAAQVVAEKLSKLGTGLKWLLGGSK
uniref:Domain of unknown function at the cortex 1 domain-containing protein n=1 Tax=Tetradesmus obliquus TaxID=3088 RepID=A0A383VSP2_TETOB|eukprot:jgi/Sobl393_1/4537/SZX67933.1